jgi:hypothetical protein
MTGLANCNLRIDEKPEVRGQKTEDKIQKQLIDLLAIYYSAYRGWKAAPTVIINKYYNLSRFSRLGPFSPDSMPYALCLPKSTIRNLKSTIPPYLIAPK